MEVSLLNFDPKMGLKRGRHIIIESIWYMVKICFFLTAFPWPQKIKIKLLRTFGAKMGCGIVIKPRVNIHFPWKLIVGDHVWLGEEVFILNFEPIIIESNVCISQRVFICGGNHDYRDPTFKYRNGPITIKSGVWVGAQSFIAPNIVINENCVITAGSIVIQSLPQGMICSGNPCKPVKSRCN